MRYYAVTKVFAKPHVIAAFADKVDAEDYDRTHSAYTEQEMLQHPDLEAALERWRDPSNHEYGTAAIAQGLADFERELNTTLNTLDLYAEDASEFPDEPVCAALTKTREAVFEILRAMSEIPANGILGVWDGPESALEQETQARIERAKENRLRAAADTAV